VNIDTAKVKAIEIKMRMDKGDFGQIFFADRYQDMDQEKSVKFDVVRPAHEVKRVEVTAGDGKEVRVHVMQHPRTP